MCVNDVDKFPLEDRSSPSPSLFFFDLGQALSSSLQWWKSLLRHWAVLVHAHAVLQTGNGREGFSQDKNQHEGNLVQAQMLVSSGKGLLILLGFCLAFLTNCCYSLLPDSIKSLM